MKKITIFLLIAIMISSTASFASDYNDKKGKFIPILMYHHISEEPTHSGIVTSKKFNQDMLDLKEKGYTTIHLNEIVDYLNGKKELPEKPIVVTFDDGYKSNYEYAFKVAKKENIKFTISPIIWSVGQETFLNSDKKITPHFTWLEMKEMYDTGLVDIQNHTFDLHSPKGKSYGYKVDVNKGVLPMDNESFLDYKSRLSNDLWISNYKIFEHLNTVPNFFVYPYGAYTEDTEKILNQLGFIGTITTKEGVRYIDTLEDLKELPRINVDNDTSIKDIIKTIEKYK